MCTTVPITLFRLTLATWKMQPPHSFKLGHTIYTQRGSSNDTHCLAKNLNLTHFCHNEKLHHLVRCCISQSIYQSNMCKLTFLAEYFAAFIVYLVTVTAWWLWDNCHCELKLWVLETHVQHLMRLQIPVSITQIGLCWSYLFVSLVPEATSCYQGNPLCFVNAWGVLVWTPTRHSLTEPLAWLRTLVSSSPPSFLSI